MSQMIICVWDWLHRDLILEVGFFSVRMVTACPVDKERLRLGICIAPLFPIDMQSRDFQTVTTDHRMSLAKMQLLLRGCWCSQW